MAPKMSVVRKLLLGSPASFKQQRKSEAARSSTPYKICSSRKATNLPPKPTRHRAKRLEAANQLRVSPLPGWNQQLLDEVRSYDCCGREQRQRDRRDQRALDRARIAVQCLLRLDHPQHARAG